MLLSSFKLLPSDFFRFPKTKHCSFSGSSTLCQLTRSSYLYQQHPKLQPWQHHQKLKETFLANINREAWELCDRSLHNDSHCGFPQPARLSACLKLQNISTWLKYLCSSNWYCKPEEMETFDIFIKDNSHEPSIYWKFEVPWFHW